MTVLIARGPADTGMQALRPEEKCTSIFSRLSYPFVEGRDNGIKDVEGALFDPDAPTEILASLFIFFFQ
jgi:hypothetical protein